MMKGVILAAGKGSRLYPVTLDIPKPLLPMANRMTLEYAFDQLRDCGVTDICIVVGENEDVVRQALGDGSQFGVNLGYVRQTDPKGLAHAVGFAKEFVGRDDFILYLGDAIYSESLREHVEKFRDSECSNLNLVKPVEDPRRFGVANVEGDRIVKLVEKPAEPESNLAMAGMYVFGPAIWEVLPYLQPSARGEFEITDAIQMLIDQGHVVLASVYEGEWFDTGTLDSFLETSQYLAKNQPLIDETALVDGEICGCVVIGKGATVKARKIVDSVVLPGSQVTCGGTITGSLLSGTVQAEGDIIGEIRNQ
ncbi:sugar phosphate nucleotidyltransferase [Kamptonema cortianum]|nr:sugar phosphate nucleotidyltransferase [Geitlerinema splendidum]MDK3156893.1 sugar phosphate nucleotidyltransferase [Kamptonema cortianum]